MKFNEFEFGDLRAGLRQPVVLFENEFHLLPVDLRLQGNVTDQFFIQVIGGHEIFSPDESQELFHLLDTQLAMVVVHEIQPSDSVHEFERSIGVRFDQGYDALPAPGAENKVEQDECEQKVPAPLEPAVLQDILQRGIALFRVIFVPGIFIMRDTAVFIPVDLAVFEMRKCFLCIFELGASRRKKLVNASGEVWK